MERLISASFCFVLCSHELPKSEPTCLLNRLEGDTLCLEDKDNGIPERGWESFLEPLHGACAFSSRRKQETGHPIEEQGNVSTVEDACPARKRAGEELLCGLKTIAHSNKIQERRMSNRQHVQNTSTYKLACAQK